MSNDKESVFKTDKERNDYQADSEFILKYWKDDEYFDESIPFCVPESKPIEYKPHVFGIDLKMDHVVNELNRLKKQKENKNV